MVLFGVSELVEERDWSTSMKALTREDFPTEREPRTAILRFLRDI